MKRRIRLTEGDLHRIVKESVNRMLSEKRTDYDDLMKQETLKTFNTIAEHAKMLVALLNGLHTDTCQNGGEGISPGFAKHFGYTKSYKRLSKALTYAEKARDLILAAKQDMQGEYGDERKFKIPNIGNHGEGSGFSSNGIGYF